MTQPNPRRIQRYPVQIAFLPTWLATRGDDIAVNTFAMLQGYGAGASYVRPSVSELARQTHHSRSTIYAALRRLVAYGVLLERPRPNGLREWHCLAAREDELGEAS